MSEEHNNKPPVKKPRVPPELLSSYVPKNEKKGAKREREWQDRDSPESIRRRKARITGILIAVIFVSIVVATIAYILYVPILAYILFGCSIASFIIICLLWGLTRLG